MKAEPKPCVCVKTPDDSDDPYVGGYDELCRYCRYSKVTMVTKFFPVAILTTCKLVNQEAIPFLEQLHNELIRFIVNASLFGSFVGHRRFLREIVEKFSLDKFSTNPSMLGKKLRGIGLNEDRDLNHWNHDNLMSVDMGELCHFTRAVAAYLWYRAPKSNIIAIMPHATPWLSEVNIEFGYETIRLHQGQVWDLLPGPVGFMLRYPEENFHTHEEEDRIDYLEHVPATLSKDVILQHYQEWGWNNSLFREHATATNTKHIDAREVTVELFYVERANDEERNRIWRESE